jgi:hypothetical protein
MDSSSVSSNKVSTNNLINENITLHKGGDSLL